MRTADWRCWWVTCVGNLIVGDERYESRAQALAAWCDDDDQDRAHGAINLRARQVFIPTRALRAMRRSRG